MSTSRNASWYSSSSGVSSACPALVQTQIAYYESLGLEGMKAYADTLKAVREAGDERFCCTGALEGA